jgi:hypothetical protein
MLILRGTFTRPERFFTGIGKVTIQRFWQFSGLNKGFKLLTVLNIQCVLFYKK